MNKRIARAKKKVNGTVPEFYKQGDFTICVVEHNGKRFVGVTKRNVRTDSPNEERAKTIAYERALKGESVRLWTSVATVNLTATYHIASRHYTSVPSVVARFAVAVLWMEDMRSLVVQTRGTMG